MDAEADHLLERMYDGTVAPPRPDYLWNWRVL
jgi:hypothetical protein